MIARYKKHFSQVVMSNPWQEAALYIDQKQFSACDGA